MAYKFPWTNYHELNLDWILDTVKKLFAQTEQNNAVVEQYDGRLTEVELTADNAQTAAEQAQSDSAAALSLAQGAQTTATQAQQVAAQAQQAAGQAQTAAGQAQEAAATAQQTATQAQQTAQNFDGRITQAENNAANALQAAQAFDEQVQGAITAANNANEAATLALTTATETSRELAAQRSTLEDIIENAAQSLEVDLSTKADVIINTAEGEIASFNDGADDMKIKNLIVNIEPIQSGSGDPSPDNVRPITGWTGAEVQRTGVNVFGGKAFADTIMEKVPDATIDAVNKTVTYSASKIQRKIIFDKFKPNTQYTIFLRNTGSANLAVDYTDGTRGGITVNGITVTNPSKSVQRIIGEWHTGDTTVYYEDFGVFEGVLTADDFEPYTGDQISVNWEDEAGTVYGGTLDVINGVLTVDKAYALWAGAMSEIYIRDVGDYGSRFRCAYADAIQTAERKQVLCNMGFFSGSDNVGTTFLNLGNIYYYPPSTITTIEEFKTWLSTNNLQFVYPLATPIEYQLTPQKVKTLYQYNNIWSDVGSVDVEYLADTKLYIDNKFAELQALILEH